MKKNSAVTTFIKELDHPLKAEIEWLRHFILKSNPLLSEHIKWNAPSFCLHEDDRITMKLYPPKNIQLIFHRGAKVKEPLPTKLIDHTSSLLRWAANDRAVASFTSMEDIKNKQEALQQVIQQWLEAAP